MKNRVNPTSIITKQAAMSRSTGKLASLGNMRASGRLSESAKRTGPMISNAKLPYETMRGKRGSVDIAALLADGLMMSLKAPMQQIANRMARTMSQATPKAKGILASVLPKIVRGKRLPLTVPACMMPLCGTTEAALSLSRETTGENG